MEHTSQTIISRRYVTQNGRSGWWTGKKVIFLVLAVLFGIVVAGKIAMMVKEYQVAQEAEQRRQLYNKILDAASVKPTEIQIDYAHSAIKGSPLVFGASQYPNWHSEDVWDKIQEVGITSMRTDFYLEHMAPYTTSLIDYKINRNDVKNPSKWQLDFIKSRKDAYTNSQKRGMKTIGIVSYAPPWLTYSHTTHGVPMDWDVYEDVVKRAYKIHRNNIDYVEIWNEPTNSYFLDVSGSGMTQTEAYAKIFYHAAKAIREVDEELNDGKHILIGGPVGANPQDTSMLEAILQDDSTRKYIDFISYHNYVMDEPSWDTYKAVLAKYQMEDYPIYVTEWNFDPEDKHDNPNKTTNLAIFFTSNKLIDFLKMGVAGANYYSLLEIVDNDPKRDTEYLGFYKWTGDHTELLPQAKSWRILSKDMALGKGESKIYTPVTDDTEINTIGFTNIEKDSGIAIVNASPSAKMIDMRFTNLPIQNFAKVTVYYASAENDAKTAVYEGTLKVTDGATRFDFYLPKETVMGVKLSQEREWFNVLGF